MRVDVYRNLNEDCISVRSREPDTRGQVVDHVEEVFVKNVEFVVQPSGRKRVLEEERKNVHAFVRGIRCDDFRPLIDFPTQVTYNPYDYASFVERADGTPVETATHAVVSTNGVEAYGVKEK